MSSRTALRNPTWRGLRPGLPRLAPAPPELAAAIRRATGGEGDVQSVLFDAGEADHARLDPRDGGPALFLKIVPGVRAAHQERAEGLARWLAARELPVNACLDGYPVPVDDDHVLFAYRWRDGRRLRSDEGDLSRLGRGLAALHAGLASYPARGDLEASTADRLAELRHARADLAAGRPAGPDFDRLARLAQDGSLDFEAIGGEPTPLHDDLNPGNLLMVEPEGELLFLDFEDAVHGVLPVVFDLGLVIERLVSALEPDDARAVALGRAFLEAYRDAGGVCEGSDGGLLAASLRARSLRSLCTLALCEWSGIEVVAGEWEKFFDFEALAQRRAHVLRRIWAGRA